MQKSRIGKWTMLLLVFLGFSTPIHAQGFGQQFYFERGKGSYDFTLASLSQHSDSLASIEFRSSDPNNRAYFAFSYLFINDTLFLTELSESIETERKVETASIYLEIGLDSFYLRFDSEQSFNSKPEYDSVFFEINGKQYYKSDRCFTEYCAIAPKPKEREFQVKVWSGKKLIDTFDFELYNSRNILLMRKLIFGSSKVFQPMSYYESKFPTQLKYPYQGKNYFLKVRLQSKEFHDSKLAVEK